VEPETPQRGVDAVVPRPLRLAAAIGWRVLVVAAAIAILALALAQLRVVFLPIVLALVLASTLAPPARWLRERGVPSALAALAVLALCAALLAAVGAVLAPSASADFRELGTGIEGGIAKATDWALEGPLDLSREELDRYRERGVDQARERAGDIAGGVFGGAYLLIEVVAGLVLSLVLLFFFLKDGDRMWPWVVRLFPVNARDEVDEVGHAAWATLGGYLRGVTVVALVDAVFIGLALWLLDVPLVLPLALLTFLGGFLPIVGAFAAGIAAALVALVSKGFATALLVVAATILVQQLESHLLQPFIVGRAVRLHPVAVILAVTAGAVIWGIAGAFLAVPLVAVIARASSLLRARGEQIVAAPAGELS
jgi:putative heme transporter